MLLQRGGHAAAAPSCLPSAPLAAALLSHSAEAEGINDRLKHVIGQTAGEASPNGSCAESELPSLPPPHLLSRHQQCHELIPECGPGHRPALVIRGVQQRLK